MRITYNKKKIPNTLVTLNITKAKVIITETPKTLLKKIRSKQFKMTIKAITTLIKVLCTTKTYIIALIFQNLIIQQISKNTTLIPNMAVCQIILANVILY